jgi:hypothetical protein
VVAREYQATIFCFFKLEGRVQQGVLKVCGKPAPCLLFQTLTLVKTFALAPAPAALP